MKVLRIKRRTKYPLFAVIVYFLIMAALVAVDQAVKQLVVTKYKNSDLPLIGNYIRLYYTENTGAAFSIMQGKMMLLIIATSVMVAVCITLLITQKLEGKSANMALALISAGGLGNLIDRIFRGYVVDFIYPAFIRFAIFNIADSCVVAGALLLCLYLIIYEKKAKDKETVK
jgi:signal peptidase II